MDLRPSLSLPVVDAFDLDESHRSMLRPLELIRDADGHRHRLPRFYYRVDSWEEALATQLTPHFGLWELIDVDFMEDPVARCFPRFIPCAITLLASQLETFRVHVGTVVRIAANGGYRSPGHRRSRSATPHAWGAAADIYRVGDELMDSRERIEKYSAIAREVLPGIWTLPFGEDPGHAFDHVHLDLGFVTVTPHGASEEAAEDE